MAQYESQTIFDGQGNSMRCTNPDDEGIIHLSINDESEFFIGVNGQNFLIQHFINFHPDCENIVLRRVSYELQTMQKRFDDLIVKYHQLKGEIGNG